MKKAEKQISTIAENNAKYKAQLEAQREKARAEKQELEEFQSDTSSVEFVNICNECTEAQKNSTTEYLKHEKNLKIKKNLKR